MSQAERPVVLVVDEALPHPPDSGKRIRTYELMRRLAGEFRIVFAYHREHGADAAAETAMRACGLDLLPVDRTPLVKHGARFAWDLGRNLPMRVPYMVMAHRTHAMRSTVRRVLAERRPALVHAEWTPLVANVRADANVPVCIAAHNVETLIWERYRANERHVARRAYIAAQVRKVRRFEKHAFRRAEAVVAVSDADAATIRAWSGGTTGVHVVPNGVDDETFAPQPATQADPGSLLFVGSLDWRPNLDAVTWFLDAIWDRIRAAKPDARFTVVGRHPPRWLVDRAAALPGVRLEASVPDVRPFVARAAVSVVPLRIGGGSRLKICEALSMACPVVSTSIGAEGLDLGDGVTLADEADGFAAAVVASLEDPAGMHAQAERGRARILERYTWDRIAPLQAAVWHGLAEAGAARGRAEGAP